MATLKKTTKKKDAGKPSTVLIIFLVFFILLSIGLGVAAYYGYEGQNKLKEDAKNAKVAENSAKANRDYRLIQLNALSNAIGEDFLQVADKDFGAGKLNEIANEGGTYGKEPDRPAFAKLLKELGDDLTFLDNEKKFKENFRAKYAAAAKEAKDAATQRDVALKALKEEQAKYAKYEEKNETNAKERANLIAKGNAAALAASAAKFESFNDLLKANKEIHDQKLETDAKLKDALDQVSTEKTRFAKFLDSLEKKNGGQEVMQSKKNGEQHALVLDMSRGVPLWDHPLGKVIRVDLDRRQLYINIGSALGAKPELTFSIFADDGKGNADKFLKGTVEIIRVLDSQTSLCRITSLYDVNGAEINLIDATAGRTAREVQAGIRDGDLIFNMFWNSHIAIAGNINFTGFPIDAPSEQMRQVETFMGLAARMGIHTDAILDLNDAQMKGAFTTKTRFLVLGHLAYPKNANDDAQKERAKLINDGIAAMKKEAMDKGLFLISAENFTIAAGYRKPRNAATAEMGKFGATVPYAGASTSGLVIQRDGAGPAAPMPMPENKDAEKKLPDAKGKEMK